uniref:Glycine rich superfamily member n=1 Tax=Rhipicephalus appendiculatus TaxID=34631 RepID=A0A131YH87_RHIAP
MKRAVAMIVITLLLGLALGHGHHGKKGSHVVLVRRPVYQQPHCFDHYGHGGHHGGFFKKHGHHGGLGHHGGHHHVPFAY